MTNHSWPTKYTGFVILGTIAAFWSCLVAVREYATVNCITLLNYSSTSSCTARGSTPHFWVALSIGIAAALFAIYGAVQDFRHMSLSEDKLLNHMTKTTTTKRKKKS